MLCPFNLLDLFDGRLLFIFMIIKFSKKKYIYDNQECSLNFLIFP
jgi:hypothetical protein